MVMIHARPVVTWFLTYFVQSAISPKWYSVTFVWATLWYPLPSRRTAHVVDQWLTQTSITHCAADIYTAD